MPDQAVRCGQGEGLLLKGLDDGVETNLESDEVGVTRVVRSTAVSRSLTAAVGGLGAVALVVASPSLRFAYRSLAGHLVLETTVALVGALVALLVYGRYQRTAALTDLLLVHALSLLSLTALAFVTLPGLLGDEAGQIASSWAALVVRLLGALLFATAAAVRPGRRHRVGNPGREVAALTVGVVLLAGAVAGLASGLPHVVQVRVGAEASSHPSLDGHPIVHAVQLISLLCYAYAAVVFTRRGADGDELLGWIGVASTMGACARLAYLLFPSLYTEWLYVGDLLRLTMYLLLLVGAVLEIRGYWQGQAAMAVHDERRRLARDLHDGVVQELGYIRSRANGLGGDAVATQIGAAADRALNETRRAVHSLVSPRDCGLAASLTHAVREVGDRWAVPVTLALDDDVTLEPDAHEALVRIAREAVGNAAQHAQSPVIAVRLSPGCLVVEDRGSGFDPGLGRPGGFGLTSMRERAEGMDATVRIESTVGHGTRVLVSW